jgi:hypothetical protein
MMTRLRTRQAAQQAAQQAIQQVINNPNTGRDAQNLATQLQEARTEIDNIVDAQNNQIITDAANNIETNIANDRNLIGDLTSFLQQFASVGNTILTLAQLGVITLTTQFDNAYSTIFNGDTSINISDSRVIGILNNFFTTTRGAIIDILRGYGNNISIDNLNQAIRTGVNNGTIIVREQPTGGFKRRKSRKSRKSKRAKKSKRRRTHIRK